MIVGSKTTTDSQAVQCNKIQYNNERIVKKLIELDQGDWEGYIKEIRASVDTNKIPETPKTKADLVTDKVKTPAQIHTSAGETNQEKNMQLSPTTQPVKCVTHFYRYLPKQENTKRLNKNYSKTKICRKWKCWIE